MPDDSITLRIEDALERSVARACGPAAPSLLAHAMRHAVFPGGARIRPRLALSVAHACGDDRPIVASAAAAAIELLHCASLVHDDMPCFDNADMRRGKPVCPCRVRGAPGSPGRDGLIVLAFETAALAACGRPLAFGSTRDSAGALGRHANGIVAGQGWETRKRRRSPGGGRLYQRAKTGALFAGAAMAGAAAAGHGAERMVHARPLPGRGLSGRRRHSRCFVFA